MRKTFVSVVFSFLLFFLTGILSPVLPKDNGDCDKKDNHDHEEKEVQMSQENFTKDNSGKGKAEQPVPTINANQSSTPTGNTNISNITHIAIPTSNTDQSPHSNSANADTSPSSSPSSTSNAATSAIPTSTPTAPALLEKENAVPKPAALTTNLRAPKKVNTTTKAKVQPPLLFLAKENLVSLYKATTLPPQTIKNLLVVALSLFGLGLLLLGKIDDFILPPITWINSRNVKLR